jgi:hypothetical protein
MNKINPLYNNVESQRIIKHLAMHTKEQTIREISKNTDMHVNGHLRKLLHIIEKMCIICKDSKRVNGKKIITYKINPYNTKELQEMIQKNNLNWMPILERIQREYHNLSE